MIQCNRCNLQYIGETKRRLKDRFNEHRRTIDNPNNKSKPTTAAEHFLSSPNHTANDMIANEPAERRRAAGEAAALWSRAKVLCWRKKSRVIEMRVCKVTGAIHSTKISGNFGPKLNGSVRSNRKSFEKTGPPFEVVLFSRSDRLEFWLNGSRPTFLSVR